MGSKKMRVSLSFPENFQTLEFSWGSDGEQKFRAAQAALNRQREEASARLAAWRKGLREGGEPPAAWWWTARRASPSCRRSVVRGG